MSAVSDASAALTTALPAYVASATEVDAVANSLIQVADLFDSDVTSLQWKAGELRSIAKAIRERTVSLSEAQSRLASITD